MGWQHLIRIASVQNKERAIARIIQIRSHSPGLLDPTEQNGTALLALQLLFCQTRAANIHGTRLLRRLSLPNCCCVSLTLQIVIAYDPDGAMEAPAGVCGADPCHDVGSYRVSSAYAEST